MAYRNKQPAKRQIGEIVDTPKIPRKKPGGSNKKEDDRMVRSVTKDIYRFQILMPNRITVEQDIHQPGNEMSLRQFLDDLRPKYLAAKTDSGKPRREIAWDSAQLHFVDSDEIINRLEFKNLKSDKCHRLKLCDGLEEAETFENMWDLTPDTDLLKEFPQEYTFETALADLIDNSLQAVWSNRDHKPKLISVELSNDKIMILDTGPGMDGSEENTITKWGRFGASLHRSSKQQAIGGKPPYLTPHFGMFGYGGPVASMHLGRKAEVSSRTKECKKVYMLFVDREALLSSCSSKQSWKTPGGLRDPSDDELQKSRDGSFTKVEIFKPKVRNLDINQIQYKLKDIYFPYIQCHEFGSGRTMMPIEFQVNGTNLAEIEGGEVATTNLHSCNGPDFVLQLHLRFFQGSPSDNGPGPRHTQEANARLKCVYFPIIEGKESIEKILEKLQADSYGVSEEFKNFSRVSIRRLGRLLPDARWLWLPFMEPKHRKGDKGQLLKRCSFRVKCFIDTDAGFNPTPSKTDLAGHHPFTTALKNLGYKSPEKEEEVHLEIYKDEKLLTLSQLDKQYQEWILQMHDHYDKEIDCGEDQPTFVPVTSNMKKLGINSDVVRIHKTFQRKGRTWSYGQRIKILKGACTRFHKNNVFATLEFIILGGWEGDAGGDAKVICRPLGVENGCAISVHKENPTVDMGGSFSIPISVIDSGMCITIEESEWTCQLQKYLQKTVPSSIDVLGAEHCQELDIAGDFPGEVVDAGHQPPECIAAVIRPAAFCAAGGSKSLDQKHIIKESYEMTLAIKLAEDGNNNNVRHLYSSRAKPSSLKGFHGLYIFSMKKLPMLFQKAGIYSFSFSLGSDCKNFEKKVKVQSLPEIKGWRLLDYERHKKCRVRVGSHLPPLVISCCDRYDNHVQFTSVPEVEIKCSSSRGIFKYDHSMNDYKLREGHVRLRDVVIKSGDLDNIRPSYDVTLRIFSKNEEFSVEIPLEITPGPIKVVTVVPQDFGKELVPGYLVKELLLECFDEYGNHVKKGEEVQLHVNGLCFEDKIGSTRKVDDDGSIDLSGILKVTAGYGKSVSISLLSEDQEVFTKEFQTEIRELRATTEVPKLCVAGSQLENMIFEVVNAEGEVDENIHDDEKEGLPHTLRIRSDSMDIDESVRYSFQRGRCTVRSIDVPQNERSFCFIATHSRHPELELRIQINVERDAMTMGYKVQSLHEDGNTLLLEGQSGSKVPKEEPKDIHTLSSDTDIVLAPLYQLRGYVGTADSGYLSNFKNLEDVLLESGVCIGQNEEELVLLDFERSGIEQDISETEEYLKTHYVHELEYTTAKSTIREQIDSKKYSAAAIVCSQELQYRKQHPELAGILGVVALLGTVETLELSRIFAQYLGEDLMLAVVCKSYSATYTLHKGVLHEIAHDLGKSINGRYSVICIDDIRPYKGQVSCDYQRRLALSNPEWPNGGYPDGFIDYAVNMIQEDADLLQWRTASGHGLRETLFYRLFGKVQVYTTKDLMNAARSCIEDGAVSLDGGILKGNGVMSLGDCKPEIIFPVASWATQTQSSPRRMVLVSQLEEKKEELSAKRRQMIEVGTSLKRSKKRFDKVRNKYNMWLDIASELGSSTSQLGDMNNTDPSANDLP